MKSHTRLVIRHTENLNTNHSRLRYSRKEHTRWQRAFPRAQNFFRTYKTWALCEHQAPSREFHSFLIKNNARNAEKFQISHQNRRSSMQHKALVQDGL